MTNIVDIIDNFHKIDFNIFSFKKKNLDFLKNYRNNKILLIGFDNINTDYDNIPLDKLSRLQKHIDNYDLFVIDKKFSCLSREKIQSLIEFFEDNKKNVIFSGYSTYFNLNIDNCKQMFRPIDITRKPFIIKNKFSIIGHKISKYFTFSFITIILFFIIANIKYNHILLRVDLFIFIFFIFILPYHKYIYLKND